MQNPLKHTFTTVLLLFFVLSLITNIVNSFDDSKSQEYPYLLIALLLLINHLAFQYTKSRIIRTLALAFLILGLIYLSLSQVLALFGIYGIAIAIKSPL